MYMFVICIALTVGNTITVTYFDYIIVFEVLFCQNFTWGGVYVPLTSLLGS